MIRRLRQLPNGGIRMMPDNPVVRPEDAFDGELRILGKVVWIGRRIVSRR
jgi:phage repressor protein C with HTH and peptisase S24 domain